MPCRRTAPFSAANLGDGSVSTAHSAFPQEAGEEVKAIAGVHGRAGSRNAARRSRQGYYLLRTGQLRSIKIGKLRRITEQQLADSIASLGDVA